MQAALLTAAAQPHLRLGVRSYATTSPRGYRSCYAQATAPWCCTGSRSSDWAFEETLLGTYLLRYVWSIPRIAKRIHPVSDHISKQSWNNVEVCTWSRHRLGVPRKWCLRSETIKSHEVEFEVRSDWLTKQSTPCPITEIPFRAFICWLDHSSTCLSVLDSRDLQHLQSTDWCGLIRLAILSSKPN